MKLEDYIKLILEHAPVNTPIEVEVNLYSDITVTDMPTGNKVKFTIYKGEKINEK